MKLKVITVIVNYNKPYDVIHGVKKVYQGSILPEKILVIDNASTDNSIEILENHLSGKIDLIKNSENKGGSGGFSTGIKIAMNDNPDYIWLMDDDAYPHQEYLEYALKTFSQFPKAGIVGAQLLDINNPEIIVELGANINWNDVSTTPIKRREKKLTKNIIVMVDYVPACCMIISKKIISQIGLFEKKFFIHWDDMEYGYRANQNNFQVVVNSQAIAYHKQFDKPALPLVRYYDIRNSYFFYLKKANNLGMKIHIFWQILYKFIQSPFIANPFDFIIYKNAVLDMFQNKMGKLVETPSWEIQIANFDCIVLSHHLALHEKLFLAKKITMLDKDKLKLIILFDTKTELEELKNYCSICLTNSIWNYIKIMTLGFKQNILLLSPDYYTALDFLPLTKAHYDGNFLLKKPVNIRVLWDFIKYYIRKQSNSKD
ncbi:glycosyltransferase [Candidatus Venteria ishoeyi]|uniref:Galactofuranosyl transferase GlfT2 n=1 Tax=Candidatus Venteria ishoeyi TaxID=1899563 RepID=A0A1H6F4U1_9GAMM|nr:glycosyltransferase [Candidatus Venteria ishoeyi]SEH04573.1 Galactofuranosyl transferase GlfT2 [Candidatus Venteria ishoeyi]